MFVGEKRSERVKLSVINYDGANFQEKEVNNVEEAMLYRKKSSVTWLNIDGVHQPEIIEQVGKSFGVHPLVLEDIANTGQRPKVEDFEDYIFVVLRMLSFDEKLSRSALFSDLILSYLSRKGKETFSTSSANVSEAIRGE